MLIPLVDQDDIQQRSQKKLARTMADEDKALETFGLTKKVQRILREQQGKSRPGSKLSKKKKKKNKKKKLG